VVESELRLLMRQCQELERTGCLLPFVPAQCRVGATTELAAACALTHKRACNIFRLCSHQMT
jgi:hypothetical protein